MASTSPAHLLAAIWGPLPRADCERPVVALAEQKEGFVTKLSMLLYHDSRHSRIAAARLCARYAFRMSFS